MTTNQPPATAANAGKSSENAIEIRGLKKSFGRVEVLHDMNLTVKEGEIFSLLGPSGCGKTTALRCVAGLETVDDGEILLNGEVVTSPRKHIMQGVERREIGLVFQNYALWPHMTVFENVAFGLKQKGVAKDEIEKKVTSYLKLVGLENLEKRYPFELSGGQQQRVALARSLVYEPKVLLLDEPLSNLDLKVRMKVRGELRALLTRIKVTTLYVTHDQEEAFVLSDNVALLNGGKIVQQGQPHELYDHPSNQFVAEFVGSTNLFEASLVSTQGDKVVVHAKGLDLDLTAKRDPSVNLQKKFMIMIRPNEIVGVDTPPRDSTNVLKAELESTEYRGSETNYVFKVGNSRVHVVGHRFCGLLDDINQKLGYVHLRPDSITMVPAEDGAAAA